MSARIRELRERLDLNQEQLGERVGVTRQTIAAWERGQREPTITQLTRVAQALGVPTDLLLRQEGREGAKPVHLLFRADQPSSLTDTDLALLSRRAADYAEIERKLELLPLLPESRPMDGYISDAVEQVAQETRDWVGVEEAPLGDVFALLERRGLKIIRNRLPDRVWGFSAYTEEWGGVIYVNTHSEGQEIPTERQYFTALHELAHLIFHRREYLRPSEPAARRDPREEAANHFAGAVLLPANALYQELRQYAGRWLPEPLLVSVKQKYGASIGTIIIRAAQLGLMSREQKGRQLGHFRKRYPETHGEPPHSRVPAPLGVERLRFLVFAALVQEKITASKAAEVLNSSLYDVRDELLNWLPEEADEGAA